MDDVNPFLIVEDQEIIAENLRRIIVQLGYPTPFVATSYEKAIQLIEEEKISLLLLDIILKENSKDGIDLITEVQQKKIIPHIFITANADKTTIDRAKLTNPLGYIVKPFDKNNIYSNIEIALFNSSKNNIEAQRLLYVNKGQKEFINIDSILYMKADGVYMDVVNDLGKKILIRSTFKTISEELPTHFVQIHRSMIINCKKVSAFSGARVKILEEELTIGRSYKSVFLNRMEKTQSIIL